MSILEIEDDLLEPVSAHCTDTELVVRLENGASLVTPLWWYPTLLSASLEDRNAIELSPYGIHWPGLDEDLSIEGMLKGSRYPDAKPPAEAAE
jgi:hypothetical protein